MDLIQRKLETRKERISELANFISLRFFEKGAVQLEKIALDESLPVGYFNYKNYFDGLLVYDSHFSIHLNIDTGNYKGSKRSRFSMAHELGHYFIPDHHRAIKKGTFQAHKSSFMVKQKDYREEEADYFASRLLMPSVPFKQACGREKFSLRLVDRISDTFNVSKISALLRFADEDAGTVPISVFFFRNRLLSGYKQSGDFPYRNVPFKSKIGQPPPPISAIGEYYRLKQDKFKDVQELYADDWFCTSSTQRLYEQCFYSEYGYDVSVVWGE